MSRRPRPVRSGSPEVGFRLGLVGGGPAGVLLRVDSFGLFWGWTRSEGPWFRRVQARRLGRRFWVPVGALFSPGVEGPVQAAILWPLVGAEAVPSAGMGLIDAATAPLRYVLHSAESEADAMLPVKDIEMIQSHVVAAVEAIREATEQIEAHVEVIETLASSLTPLTEAVVTLTAQMQALPGLAKSVEQLTTQLGVVSEALVPVVHAEQSVARAEQTVAHAEKTVTHAEQEVSRIGHVFSRRRQQ